MGTIQARVWSAIALSKYLGPGPTLVLGYTICGVGWTAAALAPATAWGVAIFAAMLMLFGVGAILTFINFLALRQAVTPAPLLGRMTSTMRWLILHSRRPGRAARRLARRAFGLAHLARGGRRRRAAARGGGDAPGRDPQRCRACPSRSASPTWLGAEADVRPQPARDLRRRGERMDPLLIDVPERIETENLVLRGAAARRRAAPSTPPSSASLDELGPWLPWAGSGLSVDESEANCRRQQAQVHAARGLRLPDLRPRGRRPAKASLLGGTGLHRIDWTLRRFEIGYWRKTGCEGRGIVTEAARAMARLAFDTLGARRRRAAHGRQQRAQLEGRRARRLHARGAAALRRRRRRAASRAARASMRGCGAPRSRSCPFRRRLAEG